MKGNRKTYYIIISLSSVVIMSCFVIWKSSFSNKINNGKLNSKIDLFSIPENPIVLLDSAYSKVELSKLNIPDISLFFWFSEKCCHQCVVKEANNIRTTGVKINYLVALEPLRKWGYQRMDIKKQNDIEQKIYCMYSIYSFIKEDAVPYYFVYDKK